MNYTQLNARYREEGWGNITDEALGIDPADVEMQARTVARWAYVKFKEMNDLIKLQNELANARSKLIDELIKRLPEQQKEIV